MLGIWILTLLVFGDNGAFAATGSIYTPAKVDMAKVRTVRLSLHNTERLQSREGKKIWLSAYTGSAKLDATAQKRADYLASKNKTTHARKSSDGYYNYNSIKARFSGQNINFPKEKSGIPNFSENLARNMYKCNKADCTEELIIAIKKWFAFFMSEKYKTSKPHYNAIASKYFKVMGMGIGISNGKFFIVTHYVTQIK